MSNSDFEKLVPAADNKRRDFIRNTALAGAAATIGVGTAASAQDLKHPSTDKPRLLTAAFDARYQAKITKADVYDVLEQMFDIAGCPNCGLSGIDLRLGLDPIFDVRSQIPVNVGFQF